MSSSAPPPASLSTQRNLRPWYLIVAMISSWLIGVLGLSDSFAKVMFLRDNAVPDIPSIIRDLSAENEPFSALGYLFDAAHLHALASTAQIAFPLFVGKLILSVLLVITSAMAMSGRPGSRPLAIQAHLAFAALSVATFWLLRDARYAAIDVLQSVQATLSNVFPNVPANVIELCRAVFTKSSLLWSARVNLAIFGVGALLVGALTLMTSRTKAFFEAVATATDETEDL